MLQGMIFALAMSAIPGLYASEAPSFSIQHAGRSARADYGRLSLYRLKGGAREMGQAAGALAPRGAFDPATGMIPFMGGFVQNLLLNQDFVARNPWLRPMIGPFLEAKYYSKMGRKVHPELRAFVEGMASTSGMGAQSLFHALMNPDVAHVVVSDYLQNRLLPVPVQGREQGEPPSPSTMPHSFGCTTFTVPPELTQDGRFYVARVQDYPGVGKFDAFPTLYYLARPGAYRYVQAATAGIASGVITAMNEHGLVVILHTGMTLDASAEKSPGLATTQLMVEGARSIEEAKALCDANTPAAGWIINLADVVTGSPRSAWLEVAPGANTCHLTFAEGVMISNNHYKVAANLAREIHVGPSWDQNSPDRGARARQAIEEKLGADHSHKLSLPDVAAIMADRMDLTLGRPHAIAPGAVASIEQIKAVVFSPLTREVFISDGRAPPAARGRFIRVHFDDFENLEQFATRDTSEDFQAEDAVRGTNGDLTRYPAYEPYLAATLKLDGHSRYDVGAALPFLEQAVAAEPAEPLVRLMRGFMYLRVRRYEEGLRDLEIAAAHPGLDTHRRRVATYMRGQAFDVLGQRAAALVAYGTVSSALGVHEGLRLAAEKRQSQPATRDGLDHLSPDSKLFDFSRYD